MDDAASISQPRSEARPQKPRAVAAKTMADAVVKAEATRKARHTMGKKQKQEIHGDVTPAKPTV